MHPEIDGSATQIRRDTVYCCDPLDCRGGGVAIYIRLTQIAQILENFASSNEQFESLYCKTNLVHFVRLTIMVFREARLFMDTPG